MWGGVSEGSNGGINPDSKAKSWAVRREALTNQYVSRLAEQAAGKGRAALDSNNTGDESKDASRKGGPVTKNLSQLSAGALEVRSLCGLSACWCKYVQRETYILPLSLLLPVGERSCIVTAYGRMARV